MRSEHFLGREKLLGERHGSFQWVLVLISLLVIANLAFLNYRVLFTEENKAYVQNEGGDIIIASGSAVSASPEYVCDGNCQKQIDSLVNTAISKQNISTGGASSIQAASQVSEYFIPLGAGTVNSTSWTTVSGLQAQIDGSAYGNIQTATFEITVSVPTGNQTVNLQLYNATANHPVWFSGVTFSGGGTPQLLISSPINLDPGTNTYVVQAQTQLPFQANIDQARVHIITQ